MSCTDWIQAAIAIASLIANIITAGAALIITYVIAKPRVRMDTDLDEHFAKVTIKNAGGSAVQILDIRTGMKSCKAPGDKDKLGAYQHSFLQLLSEDSVSYIKSMDEEYENVIAQTVFRERPEWLGPGESVRLLHVNFHRLPPIKLPDFKEGIFWIFWKEIINKRPALPNETRIVFTVEYKTIFGWISEAEFEIC